MGTGQVQRHIRVERIIVASIITDFKNKWPEVSSCIEPSMFRDQWCRRVFRTIEDLDRRGKAVDIVTVWEAMDSTKARGLRLMSLVQEYDFDILNWKYGIMCRAEKRPRRNVTFADYVTQLIKNNERYR